jgi:hypothetical protein
VSREIGGGRAILDSRDCRGQSEKIVAGGEACLGGHGLARQLQDPAEHAMQSVVPVGGGRGIVPGWNKEQFGGKLPGVVTATTGAALVSLTDRHMSGEQQGLGDLQPQGRQQHGDGQQRAAVEMPVQMDHEPLLTPGPERCPGWSITVNVDNCRMVSVRLASVKVAAA